MLEDDYFRKKDKELVDRMRQAAADAAAREGMSAKTGLTDPDILRELLDLGFTPDTVSLLSFLPLVQVAWAEGWGHRRGAQDDRHVGARSWDSGRQRRRSAVRRLAPDTACRQVFARARRLVAAALDAQGSTLAALTADDLVQRV